MPMDENDSYLKKGMKDESERRGYNQMMPKLPDASQRLKNVARKNSEEVNVKRHRIAMLKAAIKAPRKDKKAMMKSYEY